MNEYDLNVELKREQQKLNEMIDKVMGNPIAKNEEIIEQSRKVDKLIEKIQKKRNKNRDRDDFTRG